MNTPGAGKGVCRNSPIRLASPLAAQRVRQAQQVIVMHPDQVVGAHQRRQAGGEQVVDPAVALEFRPLEMPQADLIVQHRPQRAVGEAAVEFVVVLPRQIDREQRDRPDIAFRLGVPVRRSGFASPVAVTSPLQPNHRPPFCFSASSTPAARPPAVASPSWIGATRLETTTRRDMDGSASFVPEPGRGGAVSPQPRRKRTGRPTRRAADLFVNGAGWVE